MIPSYSRWEKKRIAYDLWSGKMVSNWHFKDRFLEDVFLSIKGIDPEIREADRDRMGMVFEAAKFQFHSDRGAVFKHHRLMDVPDSLDVWRLVGKLKSGAGSSFITRLLWWIF